MKISNIAELKTRRGTTGFNINVLGYYSDGDGGGGEFYWDNTSTETDNGGTIIKVTGLTTGRWKRIYNNTLSTKWFGMIGDGITDDSSVIQKSLDSLRSGDVLLINGTSCFISSQLVISVDNVIIDGCNSIIKASTSMSTTTAIIKTTKNNIIFRNIKINGNKTISTGVGYGIFLKDSQFCRIENCEIYGTCQCPIRLEDTNNTVIENNILHDCGISGFSDNHGILIYSLDSLRNSKDNILIQNNYIYNIKRKGIATSTVNNVRLSGISIKNNKLLNCELGGIYLSLLKDSVICDNILNSNNIGIQLDNSERVSIINNSINDSSNEGIVTYDISDVSISNNIICNSGTVGINIQTISLTNKNLLICSNMIKNTNVLSGAYAAAISLSLTIDSLVIANKMIDSRVTILDIFGVVEQSTSNYNQFINNVAHRNTQSSAVYKQGLNSIIDGNIYY